MKNSFEVTSVIKFINVEVSIEVQSFKCIAEVQLVIGENSNLLDRELIDYRKGEFMGLPVDSMHTFRKQMKDNFGVDVNKLIYDQMESILTDKVCKKIIAEN
jgi:hypothetical protein